MATSDIKLNVKGGLGNQIFGLAAGWAIAVETESNLWVNGSDISWRGSNRSRKLELDLFDWSNFPNKLNFIQTKKVPSFGRVGNQISTRLFQEIYNRTKTVEFRDQPKDFPRILSSALSGKILDGNYIDFGWLNLASKYKFPIQFNLINKMKDEIKIQSDTAVHVRLGDFLKYPDIFPIASENYYEKALESLGSINYDVFTDDPVTASKMYPKLFSGSFRVIDPKSLSGPNTFALLSRYSKIVTSASTFSSIAAWSISRNGGLVACPEKMILSEATDSRPRSWMRISD